MYEKGGKGMISRRARRRFVATIYIISDTQDAQDIPEKIHFGFQSLQTISGTPARILSPEVVCCRSDGWSQ